MSKEELDALAAEHPEGPGPAPDANPDPRSPYDEPQPEPTPGPDREFGDDGHAEYDDGVVMLEPDPQLVTVCSALAAAIFQVIAARKGWEALTPAETLKIGQAAASVAAQYHIHLGPKAAAWYALGMSVVAVTVPRQLATRERQAAEPAEPAAPPGAGNMPEGYVPPAAGADTSAPDPADTSV